MEGGRERESKRESEREREREREIMWTVPIYRFHKLYDILYHYLLSPHFH